MSTTYEDDKFTQEMFDAKELFSKLEKGKKAPNNALSWAVKFDYQDLVKPLLNHGARPTENMNYPLEKACELGQTEVVKLLLVAGARTWDSNIDEFHLNEGYCLEEAIRHGDAKMVEMLLKAGANPFATDYTPLDIALNYFRDFYLRSGDSGKIVELVLKSICEKKEYFIDTDCIDYKELYDSRRLVAKLNNALDVFTEVEKTLARFFDIKSLFALKELLKTIAPSIKISDNIYVMCTYNSPDVIRLAIKDDCENERHMLEFYKGQFVGSGIRYVHWLSDKCKEVSVSELKVTSSEPAQFEILSEQKMPRFDFPRLGITRWIKV